MRICMDSFKFYASSAHLGLRYNLTGASINVDSTGGRRGGAAIGMNSSAESFSFSLPIARAEGYVAFAFKPSIIQSQILVACYNNITSHVDLRLTVTGALQITRNGTQLGITDSGIVQQNTWIHIQFYFKIANSPDGAVAIRINGSSTPLLNLTGQDTQNGATTEINKITISTYGSSGTDDSFICDLIIDDTTGSYNKTWPGDVKVDGYNPIGAGNNNGFTPSAGDRYACIDEVTPNDDTDYIESSTPDEVCTVAFSSIVGAGIQALQTITYGKKTDAGARSFCPVFREGGVNRDGTTVNLGDSYQFLNQIYETNPADNAIWDAGYTPEAGVKLVA